MRAMLLRAFNSAGREGDNSLDESLAHTQFGRCRGARRLRCRSGRSLAINIIQCELPIAGVRCQSASLTRQAGVDRAKSVEDCLHVRWMREKWCGESWIIGVGPGLNPTEERETAASGCNRAASRMA